VFWAKRDEVLDQLCKPKSNSARSSARWTRAVVPPIDVMLRELTALGELDEQLETSRASTSGRARWTARTSSSSTRSAARPTCCQRGQCRALRRTVEIERGLVQCAFDDAQLAALSNLCEPSQAAAVDSEAVLAPLKAAAGLRARRLDVVAHQRRFGAHAHVVFVEAVDAHPASPRRRRRASAARVPADALKGRGRLASMPVRPQFDVAERERAPASRPELETSREQDKTRGRFTCA
jgi:hypothetical protein